MPDFTYVHGIDFESILNSVARILIVFAQPISEAMREEVLTGLPDPLRFETPRWGTRTLMVASQEYPGVAVRLSYNDEILESARAQGFDVRADDLFERVVHSGFDDEPLDEEYDAFLQHIDRWLTQNHQRTPFSIVLSEPLIELDAYEQSSARWRPDMGAWLPLMKLELEEAGDTKLILSNILYGVMLYALDELDQETRATARALMAQIEPDFSIDSHWQELFADELM